MKRFACYNKSANKFLRNEFHFLSEHNFNQIIFMIKFPFYISNLFLSQNFSPKLKTGSNQVNISSLSLSEPEFERNFSRLRRKPVQTFATFKCLKMFPIRDKTSTSQASH